MPRKPVSDLEGADYLLSKGWRYKNTPHPWAWVDPKFEMSSYQLKDALELQQHRDKNARQHRKV